MQSQEVRQEQIPVYEPPTKQHRAPAVAAAAFVVVLIAGLSMWLISVNDRGSGVLEEPTPVAAGSGLPDFSADPALAPAALAAAHNSHDIDTYLSVFAEDVELSFYRTPVSLDYLRASVGWAKAMNWIVEYSDCQVNGNRMACTVTTTSDWVSPAFAPIASLAAIHVADGKITRLTFIDQQVPEVQQRRDFQKWTFENHPEDAAQMWTNRDNWPQPVFTEESAKLHLRLGAEYLEP